MLFANHRYIVFISRTEVVGAVVDSGDTPKIIKKIQAKWDGRDLTTVLQEVLGELKTHRVWLLLGQDLAYVMKANVPKELTGVQERKFIQNHVSEFVPEDFEDADWDYIEVGADAEHKKVVAFVPVKQLFGVISRAFKSLQCEVETVEPEEFALTRHENSLIGLAQKTVLTGKDPAVLNVPLAEVTEPTSEDAGQQLVSSSFRLLPRTVGLVFVMVVGVIGIATAAFFFLRSRSTSADLTAPTTLTPAASVTPSAVATPQPSPTVVVSELSVSVLNGTTVPGVAGQVRTSLTEAGFEKVTVGNAPTRNNTVTKVEIQANTDSEVLREKLRAVLIDFESVEFVTSDTDQSSSSNIIIVLGEKNEK